MQEFSRWPRVFLTGGKAETKAWRWECIMFLKAHGLLVDKVREL